MLEGAMEKLKNILFSYYIEANKTLYPKVFNFIISRDVLSYMIDASEKLLNYLNVARDCSKKNGATANV